MSRARRIGLFAGALAAVPTAWAAGEGTFRAEFAATYCVQCHGGEAPQSGFRASSAAEEWGDPELRERWRTAGEYVAQAVMPPAQARQPTDAERERFSSAIFDALDGQGGAPSGGSIVRRMNRNEYLNTLRDLFPIREVRLPVTFPDDPADQRFDTMSAGMHLTPGHLDAYHEVAIDIADRMVPLPGLERRGFEADRNSVGIDPSRTKFWTREGDDSGLYFPGINIAGWTGALWNKAFVAHASGVYRVRLTVSAEAGSGADGKPLRLGFYAFNPSDYDLPKRALRADLPRVGAVEVLNREPGRVDVEVRLERGETFQMYCENRLKKPYPDALIREPGNTVDLRRLLATYLTEAQASPEPTIRFERMEVVGPVRPLPRQQEFLDRSGLSVDRAYMEAVLLPLAERAFRRPLADRERRELITSVLEHRDVAPSIEHAIHFGIRRILLSPQFLYRETGGDLDAFDFASRLSYFLWSTMPDDELLQLAAGGTLTDAAVTGRQVRRMVLDSRSQRFVKHFAGQWLGGRKAGSVMVCDVRHVWSELIRYGMVRSSEMFVEEILRENRPIRDFIDSDFTYANEPMRIAWGIPGSEVDLRRLEADQRQSLLWPEPQRLDLSSLGPEVPAHVASRGGALGLSTVLAATGDGVESSPILRGVWVLENLFGTPPPPPPADVPALVADTSKAQTVRELLQSHQSVESCAACHVSIDPLGLALENYDAVGGWRSAYYRDESSTEPEDPVEAASTMQDGTELTGPQDIKKYLLERPRQFTEALTGLLLEYGLGRELTGSDRRVVDEIAATEPDGGYGFQDLIARVVASESFAAR